MQNHIEPSTILLFCTWIIIALTISFFLAQKSKLAPSKHIYIRHLALFSLPMLIVLNTVDFTLLKITIPAHSPTSSLMYSLGAPIVVGQQHIQTMGINLVHVLLALSVLGATVWIVRFIHYLAFTQGIVANTEPLNQHDLLPETLQNVKGLHIRFAKVHVPFTFGWKTSWIMLPKRLKFDQEAMRAVLLHEATHIRHHDFQFHQLSQMISHIFWWIPGVSQLNSQLQFWREVRADAAALGQKRISAKNYATTLLDFADPRFYTLPQHSVLTFSHTNLKQRIKAMKNTSISPRLGRLLAISSTIVFGVLVACDSVQIGEGIFAEKPTEAATQTAGQPDEDGVFLVVETPPEIIGGLASIVPHINYPDEARKAGIEGRVFVQFVVDTEGNITTPSILRSPHPILSESVLGMLHNIKFKPGMQAGKAVPVKYSLPIVFKMPKEDDKDKSIDEVLNDSK